MKEIVNLTKNLIPFVAKKIDEGNIDEAYVMLYAINILLDECDSEKSS